MAKLFSITGKALSGEWGTDDEDGNGIPVLRTTNFTNEGVVDYKDVVTRTINKKNIDEKYLRKGDIIIEKSGGSDKQPVGRVIFFEGVENTYLFNNFTGLLRVKDTEEWVPEYVFYSLYANYLRGGTRQYENKTTGLHNLKMDAYISDFDVKEYSIEKQREICKRIKECRTVIYLQRQQLKDLDTLIKSRFVELFGDVKTNKYGWEKCCFGDVATKITDGEHGTVPRVEKGEGYLYFMARNITKDGNIDLTETSYVPEEVHRKIYKRCNPEIGDILLVCVGATIGKCTIVPKDFEEFSMARSVALIKPDRQKVNSIFLISLLKSDAIQSDIFICAHAAAQAGLYTNMIINLDAFLPPLELQNQFAAFVEQTYKLK
ncbi:MAG: hypothetical protein J6A92_05135, partial [Lachnospiraceae bacterium]|nr:hypothetical protein [Lachnospiraceae bacterium]